MLNLRDGTQLVWVVCFARVGISLISLLATVSCDNAPAPASAKNNGQTLGDSAGDTCQVISSTPVAWTDTADAGTTGHVLSDLAGNCSAPFTWDASGWAGTLTVNPPTGSSIVSATVTLDQSSLRSAQFGPVATATQDVPPACDYSALEVDATVTLALPGSNVIENYPVTITLADGNTSPNLQFVVDSKEFGSWLTVAPPSTGTTVEMMVEMAPIKESCAGNITMTSTTTQGSLGTGVAQGSFASWSDSGCKVGTVPVDLSEPFQGVDLTAAIGNAFNETSVTSAWDDGTSTNLNLGVSVASGIVCAQSSGSNTVVTVPVDISASTADGRVVSLAGQGTVRATVTAGALFELDLWLSTDLVCQSSTDVPAYHSADCGQVKSVTAQLGSNRYFNSSIADFGRLELYNYQRNSTASPGGAADRVDRLTWNP